MHNYEFQTLTLYFTDFMVEDGWDYVLLYEANYEVLGNLTGDSCSYIQSLTNFQSKFFRVEIEFIVIDVLGQRRGFKFEWSKF